MVVHRFDVTYHEQFDGKGNLDRCEDLDFLHVLLIQRIEVFFDDDERDDRTGGDDQRRNIGLSQIGEDFDIRLKNDNDQPTVTMLEFLT